MHDFEAFAFNKQPGFDEAATRKAFSKAVPLRTIVVYCYDPRAVGIPEAVAREFGDVWPGEIHTDGRGNKVASTTTLFPVVVAGGRAIDALRSVSVAQHLFGIKRVVVVHHTHCGATTFTPDGIINAFDDEHGADIAALYPRPVSALVTTSPRCGTTPGCSGSRRVRRPMPTSTATSTTLIQGH